MKSKLNIGIIGASRMAQFHLDVLSSFKDVCLLGISSTLNGKKKREEVKKKYNILKSYDDYKIMIKENNFDAIFLASSVETIFSISKYILQKKINLFIEKPPGLDSDETKKLITLSKKNRLITIVGFQKSYYDIFIKSSDYLKMNGGLKSIVIEAPEYFEAIKSKGKFSNKVLRKWIYANSIHCINLFIFFAGDVKRVASYSKKFNEKIHPDSINSLILFNNGITGHYISNWMSPGKYSITLYGNKFKIIFSPLEEGKIVLSTGKEIKLKPARVDLKYKPGLYNQNRYFLDCIKNKKMPIKNNLEESLKSMLLVKEIISNSI